MVNVRVQFGKNEYAIERFMGPTMCAKVPGFLLRGGSFLPFAEDYLLKQKAFKPVFHSFANRKAAVAINH